MISLDNAPRKAKWIGWVEASAFLGGGVAFLIVLLENPAIWLLALLALAGLAYAAATFLYEADEVDRLSAETEAILDDLERRERDRKR